MAKAPEPAPEPGPSFGETVHADENRRFEKPVDPYAGIEIPEKFRRDGKPDLPAFVTSYNELEGRFLSKTEKLKAELAEEMAKDRPKAAEEYKIPKIDGFDPKEIAEHPMVEWWRGEAFSAGLSQDRFAAAVTTYLEKMQPAEITEDELKEKLGENFKQRISAVDTWATKTAKSQGEMDAFKRIATDADGIKLIERLAGLSSPLAADDPAGVQPSLSLEQLRSMQNDPRYWNPTARDAAFVKQVEDGYRKLYPDNRKTA